jgi:hypothetical protein
LDVGRAELRAAIVGDTPANVLQMMMEYLKFAVRDAAQDSKTSRDSKRTDLRMKEERAKLENKTIETAQAEARERYDKAMEGAHITLVMGVIGGSIQIIAAGMRWAGPVGGAKVSSSAAVLDAAALVDGDRDAAAAGIIELMFAVLKEAARDARADRKASDAAKAAALGVKAEKLAAERKSIDNAKQEAKDRFDSAMNAAQLEYILGIVSVGAHALSGVRGGPKTKGSTSASAHAKAAKQEDDSVLNAAACKAIAAKGRPLPAFCRGQSTYEPPSYLSRSDIDRVEQLGAGGSGGFNPNKP